MDPTWMTSETEVTREVVRGSPFHHTLYRKPAQGKGTRLHVYLSGASTFLGEVNCNKLYADLSGASNFDASGNANDFDLEVSGASVVRDYGLSIEKLSAELSGASNAFLTIEDEIDVEASGASNLHYKGNATVVRKDLSGASSIKKM